MRAQISLTALILAILLLPAAPARAVELVELKDGRLYEAEKVWVRGEKVVIRLHRPDGVGHAEFSVPRERVIPEFVFYAWRDQIEPGDVDELVRLAEWSRGAGLFGQAWSTYEVASDSSSELRAQLGEIETAMRTEHSAFLFSEAWRLFQKGEVHPARIRAEKLLQYFPDSKEQGRTLELLSIIREREQFLDEQKKRKKIENRARFQRRQMDRMMDVVAKANRLVSGANLSNPIDARQRLRVAAYRYRKSMATLKKLLDESELDDLRMMLIANLDVIRERHLKGLMLLGDLRMLVGDPGGALTAAHEVLDYDPKHDLAKDLRKRALDVAKPRALINPGWGLFGWRWRWRWRWGGWGGWGGWGPGFCGLPLAWRNGGYGIRYGTYLSAAPYVGYQRRVHVAPGVTAVKVSPRGPHSFPYPHGLHVSRIGGRTFKWADSYAFPNPNR